MSGGEFDIIKRYFERQSTFSDESVVIGIGDDCAILDIEAGYQLAVTTDSLVSGVHFFEDVDAYRLGYKSLAVNLSDLAAMGATAKWVSLAITLPTLDEKWLGDFCRGFFDLADKYQVKLIGGDTTKGPLSITVSAKGVVKKGQALTRNNAQVGDLICVSGCVGDGGVGLAAKLDQVQLDNSQAFIDNLEVTEPCLSLASLLPEYASTCIDISDGLLQDLSHIVNKSSVHAEIQAEKLPLSKAMKNEVNLNYLTQLQALHFALTGGDDYELIFTISEANLTRLAPELARLGLDIFVIGSIVSDDASLNNVQVTYQQQPIQLDDAGWDHFK